MTHRYRFLRVADSPNLLLRNRESIAPDLQQLASVALVLDLVSDADGLIEGFPPGVRAAGPGLRHVLRAHSRLVYGRMTRWGQSGPLAAAAGHDLNYIALTSALHAIGGKGQPPTPPINLLDDYAGGSPYLAMGVLAAVIEARQSGKGRVVDASIVDGTASLMTSVFWLSAAGLVLLERGTNTSDSGAHFYGVYECADGKWVSVAPIEGRFHAEFLLLMEISAEEIGEQPERGNWERARGARKEAQDPPPRRMVRAARRHRLVLRAGHDDGRSAAAQAFARPPDFRRSRRHRSTATAPRFSRSVPPTAPDAERALQG